GAGAPFLELRTLQFDQGSLEVPHVTARPRGDDPQLHLVRRVQPVERGLTRDLQGSFGPSDAPFAVGDHGEVAVLARDATRGPQLRQRLLPSARHVGRDTGRLTHRADPGGSAACVEGVLVGAFGILVEQVARGDQVLGHQVGQRLGQGTQFVADLLVQSVREGVLGQLRSGLLRGARLFRRAGLLSFGPLPAGTVVPVSAGTSTSLVAASAVLLVAPVSVPPPGRGLASGLLATVCVPAAPGVTVLLLALVTAVTALVVPVSPGTAAL